MLNSEADETLARLQTLLESAQLDDPLSAQKWARYALTNLALLLASVQDLAQLDGGSFGRGLRAALESRILAELNGRTQLAGGVTEHSVMVHLGPPEQAHVFVDVRLRVEKAKQ